MNMYLINKITRRCMAMNMPLEGIIRAASALYEGGMLNKMPSDAMLICLGEQDINEEAGDVLIRMEIKRYSFNGKVFIGCLEREIGVFVEADFDSVINNVTEYFPDDSWTIVAPEHWPRNKNEADSKLH